jgi:hypothetical protein
MPRPAKSLLEANMNEAQKKANLRTGLILASVALVFFIGFMLKMFLESR